MMKTASLLPGSGEIATGRLNFISGKAGSRVTIVSSAMAEAMPKKADRARAADGRSLMVWGEFKTPKLKGGRMQKIFAGEGGLKKPAPCPYFSLVFSVRFDT